MKPAGLIQENNQPEQYPTDPSEALEQLMDRYGSVVLRTAYFYTGDQFLAEDISQEVFLRAFRKWHSFRGESAVKTWLTTITVNVCRDKMDVRMFQEQPIDPSRVSEGRTISVEEQVMDRLKKSEVLQYLLRLSLPYQEVLYLYYYTELSTPEIAKAASLPEGTVRARLFRAREALAEAMREGGMQL